MSLYVKLLASLSSLCLEVSSSVSGSFTLLFSVSVFFFVSICLKFNVLKNLRFLDFRFKFLYYHKKKYQASDMKVPKAIMLLQRMKKIRENKKGKHITTEGKGKDKKGGKV